MADESQILTEQAQGLFNQAKEQADLADHAPFWAEEHNLLKLYGVPHTRQALREFIG